MLKKYNKQQHIMVLFVLSPGEGRYRGVDTQSIQLKSQVRVNELYNNKQ